MHVRDLSPEARAAVAEWLRGLAATYDEEAEEELDTDDPDCEAADILQAQSLALETAADQIAGLEPQAPGTSLPESDFTIKDPDSWHVMVAAAGLSSDAYLKWGEYAKVRLMVLPDGRVSGRLLRRDGGSDDEVAHMTEAERRSMQDDEEAP